MKYPEGFTGRYFEAYGGCYYETGPETVAVKYSGWGKYTHHPASIEIFAEAHGCEIQYTKQWYLKRYGELQGR